MDLISYLLDNYAERKNCDIFFPITTKGVFGERQTSKKFSYLEFTF